MRTFRVGLALLLSLNASAAAPAAVPLAQIGVAAAVRGGVKAVAAGQTVGRVIESGKPLHLNERVTTDAGGRLQIMLLDETTFTIGPNSDMVLDEFVYDPVTNVGKVSAKVTKGVFRFVTGKVARKNPDDMKVRFPVGTLGIRGTIVDGVVDGGKADVALSGPGPENNAGENPGGITVGNEHGSVDIDQSGYMTTMTEGAPPTDPEPVTDGFLEQTGSLSGSSSKQNQNKQGDSDDDEGDGSGSGKPSGNKTASSDSDEESASDESGQNTAEGGEDAGVLADQIESEQEQATTFAAQDIIENAIPSATLWESIISGYTYGIGTYTGAGTYSCSGMCSGTGDFSFTLSFNFDNKTVGSNGSKITFDTGGLSGVGQINLNSTYNYGSLTGEAIVSVANLGASNSAINASEFKFLDKDEIVAKEAVLYMSYSAGSGTNTTLADGTASGQLTTATSGF